MTWARRTVPVIAAAVAGLAARDLLQRDHALLRNFPVIGHARYLLESIGPELRQYLVAGNNEERPFTRDQRRWVYASAKQENNYFGFGTDNDIEYTAGYPIIKHRTFGRAVPPSTPTAGHDVRLPGAKVLGAARGRRARVPARRRWSTSPAMSFGSLSGNAIEALNRGAALAGCLQNTGEGGLSPYHRHGGELVFQIGTAYFGCRDEHGRFDLDRLKDLVAGAPVRALEIKLSQGAKPGLGGRAARRQGVRRDRRHPRRPRRAWTASARPGTPSSPTADSLLDWVELLAAETGLPVGIKSAVGDLGFWDELTDADGDTGRGVDFVTVDGGEGGTGAAPLIFTDSVSLPFQLGFARVYYDLRRAGPARAGRLHRRAASSACPTTPIVAFALGCDMVNVAREAMLAIGCIQAQKCHTDTCPTGVATQNPWLARGPGPGARSRSGRRTTSRRCAATWCKVAEACGVEHPGLIDTDAVEILDGRTASRPLREVYGYRAAVGAAVGGRPGGDRPADDRRGTPGRQRRPSATAQG